MVIASGISSVSGGTLIALVGDLNSVYVQADVDETDIGKVQLGQPVKVRPDAYPNQEFVGNVLRISPQGTEVQNVTTFRVTAEVTNPQQLLRAGMNAAVEIIASDLKNVLLVPAEAVHEQKDVMRLMALVDKEDNQRARAGLRPGNGNPNTKYVLVLKDGAPTPVPVQVGSVSFDYAEIKSGLSEGDSVLTVSVSQMMQEREEFKDRMKERRQIPGVKKSG
jgi:HlyD family secretion protein